MAVKNVIASAKNSNAKNSNGKTIIFDQHEEEKKREQHMKIFQISKWLRDSGNKNLYRCVQGILDPVSVKLFNLDVNKDTNKAVAEVFFPNKNVSELTDDYCNKIIKETAQSMTTNGYVVLKTLLYRDPNDPENVIGKILVNTMQ